MLYSLLAFFVFVVIPFMYFYFEEKDDDVTVGQVQFDVGYSDLIKCPKVPSGIYLVIIY